MMKRSAFVLVLVATVLATLFAQGSSLLHHSQAAPASSGNPLYILPLGDSITQASSKYHSYRYFLWLMLQDAGSSADFVGSLDTNVGGPPPDADDFDTDHEGHSMWRADQILNGRDKPPAYTGQGKLADWLKGYTPDIVLVHLGTNDVWQGQPTDSTIGELKGIINVLRIGNPDVDVLIAQLIPTYLSWNTGITELNARIPDIATEMDSPNSRVIVVNQNEGFKACPRGDTDPTCDTYDGVHPNAQGEEKIAKKWFDKLTSEICGTAKLIADINTANQSSTSSSVHLDARCGYILTEVDNNTDGPNGLPSITSPIIINGNGATIERRLFGTPSFRVFHVAAEGQLLLDELTVRGGDKVAAGGAIFNAGGDVGVFYSTISGNYADKGGGIYNMGHGRVHLTNSTVSGNYAKEGGGICNYGSWVELTYSTINKNNAGDGGGIYNHYYAVPLKLTSTIVANNSQGGDCSGYWFESNGYNLDSDGSCGLDPDKHDLPGTNPVISYLQDNGGPTWTHGLMRRGEGGATEDSPAIDHIPIGVNECGEEPMFLDQRGKGRPADGNGDGSAACDIGAFERQEGETAIELISFTAEASADHVTLAWETGTEVDNAGFNLHRATSADGPYTQINDALIPAEGDEIAGASYTYTDTDVVKGVTYYYKLEDVDIHGASTFHGPVSATPGRVHPVYLPLVVK